MVRNTPLEGNPCGAICSLITLPYSLSCLAIATPAVYTHVDRSLNQILAEFCYSTAVFS